jgi:Domain of unknown function (DUF1905)
MKFRAKIRYWSPEKQSGLAVADIPSQHITKLGGLKQRRVKGRINGAEYQSNVMPSGSGRLSLSVTQKMLAAGGVGVGDDAQFEIELVPPASKK